MATEIYIKRIDDKSIFKLFKDAVKAGEDALETARDTGKAFTGHSPEIRFSFSSGLPWVISEEDILAAPSTQFVISSATITFLNFFKHGNQDQQEQVTFSFSRGSNNTLNDSFKFDQSRPHRSMQSEGAQFVLKTLHEALSPLLRPVAPEDGGLIPTLSNLAEAFSTTYQEIASELSAAVSAVSKERSDQLTEFQEERKRLREEVANEKAAMYEEIQKELDASHQEIADERKKLEEERSKLEVSSHKDARRKQFLKLQDDLRDALAEPVADKELRRTRWAVFIALVAAAGVAGFFAYQTISAAPNTSGTTASWLLPAVKTSFLTFASLAAFLGAAAWLRYFYVRDLNAQEEMRRFRNDMARASWVMDAALEIRKEHDEIIPEEWLAGVTQGLFSARKKETLEEGAQALAALMGLSASTSFGPNGTTVEIGKKGGKAISAAMQSTD
ncbi:hypothetical protein [Celeribacter neptunius]|uniref:Uncharacterized protein n=1 Tax=Celeribacter neptunius TaxID=588602 RepID=A0A1I3P1N8_9RHOB|nr:hypothetical protein [Celeribacter neptunius]SFJ15351.1 hypothetical protein SAMN04487991_1535 [Celeribacter neptunius]